MNENLDSVLSKSLLRGLPYSLLLNLTITYLPRLSRKEQSAEAGGIENRHRLGGALGLRETWNRLLDQPQKEWLCIVVERANGITKLPWTEGYTDVSSPDDSSLYRLTNCISLFIRSWIYEIILG